MVPRSSLHSVDFKPKTLRSILKVPGSPTIEPTPWGYFRSVIDNFEWAFAEMYDPNNDVDRKCLWDELVGLMSWWELPWCIGGNFKVVCYLCERSDDSKQSPTMLDFLEFIFNEGLVDIPLLGENFT
jgi:hypothetical protein